MAAVTIRKLNDEAHSVLKQRAVEHGRSTEAEMRAILEESALPKKGINLGTYLFEKSREFGGVDLDIKRDKTPVRGASFE